MQSFRGPHSSHFVALLPPEWDFEVPWCDPAVDEGREKERRRHALLSPWLIVGVQQMLKDTRTDGLKLLM